MRNLFFVATFFLIMTSESVVGHTCHTSNDCSSGEVCLYTVPNSLSGKCVKIK